MSGSPNRRTPIDVPVSKMWLETSSVSRTRQKKSGFGLEHLDFFQFRNKPRLAKRPRRWGSQHSVSPRDTILTSRNKAQTTHVTAEGALYRTIRRASSRSRRSKQQRCHCHCCRRRVLPGAGRAWCSPSTRWTSAPACVPHSHW